MLKVRKLRKIKCDNYFMNRKMWLAFVLKRQINPNFLADFIATVQTMSKICHSDFNNDFNNNDHSPK